MLIDTSIWSLALRRRSGSLSRTEQDLVEAWRGLVEEGAAAIIGPVRQEILSGIREQADFEAIEDVLSAFDDLPLDTTDDVRAAMFYNICRSHGIAATHIDLLICAAAHRHSAPIFTTDKDFTRYAAHLPIRLYAPQGRQR